MAHGPINIKCASNRQNRDEADSKLEMDYQPYAYTQVQNISIPSGLKERIAVRQK